MTGNMLLLFSAPGGIEWLLIVLAIILLFGARKIPELAKGLGRGMREFREAKEGMDKEEEQPAAAPESRTGR